MSWEKKYFPSSNSNLQAQMTRSINAHLADDISAWQQHSNRMSVNIGVAIIRFGTQSETWFRLQYMDTFAFSQETIPLIRRTVKSHLSRAFVLSQVHKAIHTGAYTCAVNDVCVDFLTYWWSSVTVETIEAVNTKAGLGVGDANSQSSGWRDSEREKCRDRWVGERRTQGRGKVVNMFQN